MLVGLGVGLGVRSGVGSDVGGGWGLCIARAVSTYSPLDDGPTDT